MNLGGRKSHKESAQMQRWLPGRQSQRTAGRNDEREPQRDTLLTPEQNASITNQWPTYANEPTDARFLTRVLKVPSLGDALTQSVGTNVNKSKENTPFNFSTQVWREDNSLFSSPRPCHRLTSLRALRQAKPSRSGSCVLQFPPEMTWCRCHFYAGFCVCLCQCEWVVNC